MLEITVLSLLTGSLGFLALTTASWIGWQQDSLEQQQEEEEVLTPYESKENALPDEPVPPSSKTEFRRDPRQLGWEFKIVRANRNLFKNSAVLQRVCDEEAKAGWILLEKLDERRLRFKRPMVLRELIKPETLKIDPYRCHYGSSFNPTVWLGGLAFIAALVLPAYLGYSLVVMTLTKVRSSPVTPTSPNLERPPSLFSPP